MSAPAAESFTRETVLWRQRWSDKLFSFRISRPDNWRFTAGQFARIGLEDGTGKLWRAYSMVNAEWDDYLEFYSIVVLDGQLTPRLSRLEVGDTLLLDARANGFFTADRLPDGEVLWLLATGTGLAPYLSILQQPATWQRFGAIRLVHGVRAAADLNYQDFIAQLPSHPLWQAHAHKFGYLPVITRDAPPGMLSARLPELIANGELARAAGVQLEPAGGRVMICGNPKMVADTCRTLIGQGFKLSRLREPAQVVLENGW